METLAPLAIEPRLHWTDPRPPVQEPSEALWKFKPSGRETVTRTPVAVAGPLFRTTT
jgi:hypothetical protein